MVRLKSNLYPPNLKKMTYISIPYGAIKSNMFYDYFDLYYEFQFLMVRLKNNTTIIAYKN